MTHLKGKVAIVTGSSRGIGRAVALAFAQEEANLVVTYNRERASARDVVEQIKQQGGSAICLALDVRSRESIRYLIKETLNAFGEIDVLVNNAAILQQKDFYTITDVEWDDMLAVNLRGPFICSQEVLPHMCGRGSGSIINITSVGGQWGGNLAVHYAASKAGLISLTRSLARIASPSGVTVNAISPGLVATEMSEAEMATETGQEKLQGIPLGRVATPDEIGQAAVFLASERARYITGHTLNINGGMYFG